MNPAPAPGGAAAPAPAPAPAPGSNTAPAPAPAPGNAPPPPPSDAPPPADFGAQSLATTTSTGTCRSLPALPTKPSTAKLVTQFGVTPNDGKDHAAGIQAALDSLKPGEWLVFPAGQYQHSKSLRVRVPGVTLWSEGATLRATNPDDTAIMMQADNSSIYGFRLHAVTTSRGNQIRHARISINPAGSTRVKGVTIRRNIIENGGAPGTSLANGSQATGIFIYKADTFVVAENTVKRTLADAIHMTGGSINGRVIKNVVRENGDDMIAVVSYMAAQGTSVDSLVSSMSTIRESRLNRNILIYNNDVKGQYWGRGITVVGGEKVTIESNLISDTTYAAGVLLARESGYLSFGVKDVIVRNNTIRNVQTTAPVYSVGDKATRPRTGHAGIEVHSLATSTEMANSTFAAAIAVDKVVIENNTVENTASDGMRFGTGAGWVGPAGAVGNQMRSINKTALNIVDVPSSSRNTYCSGNTDDGNATSSNLCSGAKPVVTGFSMTCSS